MKTVIDIKAGSVWKDKFFKGDYRVRVFEVNQYWVVIYLDDCLIYRKMPREDFLKRYEYLGMSKAQPSDLFEVIDGKTRIG